MITEPTATPYMDLSAMDLGRAPIIQLVSQVIEEACELNASDIHFDPTLHGMRVRMRVDGRLMDRHLLPLSVQTELVSRIKVLSGLRTDEHYAAQDGRFRYAERCGGHYADMRVSIAPTYHGENAVLRILADTAQEHTLETLGFGEEERGRILETLQKPEGMILATGPTGSGKTTTLYSLLRLLHEPGISIVTIEDPVEYAIDGIRQIQTQSRTGLTFAQGLRALLRQDPDVIMVGEIRDTETAAIAVNTALTGHILVSTLHTTNAATALPRLYDLDIEPYLIASTLRLVIGQRLLRRICPYCKLPVPLGDSLYEHYPADSFDSGYAWSVGTGCDSCLGTGYKGRIAVGEALLVNDAIRDAIVAHAPAQDIERLARNSGMRTMSENAFEKARQGHTSVAEALEHRMNGLLRDANHLYGAMRARLIAPRLTSKESAVLCLRLSFLLSAGIPLLDCLRALERPSSRGTATVVAGLKAATEDGKPLAEGFRRYPRVWPSYIVYAIEAGEESGQLVKSLERAADDLERGRALKAKVAGTLAYPAVIAVAALGLTVGLTNVIFPKILPLLSGMRVALPLSTRIVIEANHALSAWGLPASAAMLAGAAEWIFAIRTYPSVRLLHDRALLRLPIAGVLVCNYHVARIAGMASALMRSGMPLARALAAVERAESNMRYKMTVGACVQSVERGQGMSAELARTPTLFPEIAVQLAHAGESSGTLVEALSFVAAYAERSIDERAKTLAALIEPAIMISLGLIVGFVAVSIISPIYSLTGHLNAP